MDLPENKQIIIFDGVCNLCNASVQFIIKNDKKDVFRFTSNQSVIGQQILKFANIDILTTDSIILFDGEKNFVTESDAALKIAKELDGVFQYFYFLIFLPKKFRDFFYKYIAENRYKWFGKQENCLLPTSNLNSKFLSEPPLSI